MNIRTENNININQSLIYGTLFNIILNDIIPQLETKSIAKKQLNQLLNILNNLYSLLLSNSHNNMETYDYINRRLMELFDTMSHTSNCDAHDTLKEIKLVHFNNELMQSMVKKLNMNINEIKSKDSFYDLTHLIDLHSVKEHKGYIASEPVRFHHNLKHNRIHQCKYNEFILDATIKMVTLPTDAKVWRSQIQTSRPRNSNNFHTLKLEIPSIIHLCVSMISKLPTSQNEMTITFPLVDILGHIT